MDDSFGGGFNATQTATAGASTENKDGLAPLVIKQVHDFCEGQIEMFGFKFSVVAIVAIVRNIETSSTKITYTVEDHTGRIDAHYWLEEGAASNSPDVMLNNYAKLFGTVRSNAGQKTLMVFKVLPVLDPNDVVTHMLEVLHARYAIEKMRNKKSGDFIMETGSDSGPKLDLEGKQLAVFQAIKSHASEEGISRQELKSKFKQISDSELNNILEFTVSEGHIYSSIDSDHFISTE